MTRTSLCLLAIVATTAAAASVRAQTFPDDSAWTPITLDGVFVTDPLGDAQGERDIVGDASNPAAYVYRDTDYLYFRLRVDEDPLQNASQYRPFGWGVALDTDGDLNGFEFLAMLDGIANPDEVSLQQNTEQATQGNARDAAEVVLETYPTSTHAQSGQTTSSFGDDPDFFVDWAIAIADLQDAGVDLTQPIRLIFGTSNNAQTLASDLLAPSTETTIADIASDPVICDGDSCEPCSDLCGPDCLRCGGATPVCDAGQCVECASSADCPAERPVCNRTTGTCTTDTGCSSDTDCTNAALPACQPDGTCGECSETNQVRCVGNEPVCDTSTGTCVEGCNSDADCQDPALPACQPDGTCGECSETNQSVCEASDSECHVPSGTCGEPCNDDSDCTAPSQPACQPSGVCGECSESEDSLCTGDTPVCDTVTGTCVVATCTTDADCDNPALPACQPGGSCRQCSATNSTACTGSLPTCDTAQGICVAARPATFEGSGISCALSRGKALGALGAMLLAAAALARRRRRLFQIR